MIHLTLNSGHSFAVPPGKVQPQTIRILGPMVVKGGDLIPNLSPWRTVITRGPGFAYFDIRRGQEMVAVFNAVAWTRDGAIAAWEAIEKQYLNTADELATKGLSLDLAMPEMPEDLPWLTTWQLPQADVIATPKDLYWMADFEQCLAQTIIQKYT